LAIKKAAINKANTTPTPMTMRWASFRRRFFAEDGFSVAEFPAERLVLSSMMTGSGSG
jgi:hypothetical protein